MKANATLASLFGAASTGMRGTGRFKKNGGISAIKAAWVDRVEIVRAE